MLTEIETATIFANSSYLNALIFFRLTTSGIGIIFMLILELNKKKIVAHKSLKLLLSLHGFWTIQLCISTFAESALQGYAHYNLREPSDLLMTTNQCLFRMIPQHFGTCGSILSMLFMAAERLKASRNLSTYESATQTNGKIRIFQQVSVISIAVCGNTCMYGFPNRVPHCSIVAVNSQTVQRMLGGAFTFFELAAMYIYISTLKLNKTLYASDESRKMSLSERYQLNENIRVIRMLVPVVLTHFAFTMVGAIGFFYFQFAGYQIELYPMLEDTINIFYLQGIAMPLIFLVRHRQKRSTEVQIVSTNKTSGQQLIAIYDGVITKGW